MATKQILNLGRGGINTDLPSVLLPENTFSNGRNVRFFNESVEATTGERIYINRLIQPNYGVHWANPDGDFSVFLKNGVAEVIDIDGNADTLFSSSDPKYSDSVWQTTTFNGGYALVINNGKSTPLYILYGSTPTFQEFPNWNYLPTLEITAKVIRPLNYSLVAANLTIKDLSNTSITSAPSTIRVSAQAPTGGFPQTWEPGLTTDTADEFEINSASPILDMVELRGTLFIYSETGIHTLNITGGISRVQSYSTSYGILNTDCAVEFDGKHFVVDRNDIYVHNGSGSIESLANGRVREYFFNNLDFSQKNKVIVKRNPKYDEIWLCYPKLGSSSLNEALVFNYKNNTWSIRDLPNLTSLYEGPSMDFNTGLVGRQEMYMLTGGNDVLVTSDTYSMYRDGNLVPYTSFVDKLRINSGDTTQSFLVRSVTPVFDKVPVTESIIITVDGTNTFTSEVDFTNPSPRDVFVFQPNNIINSGGYRVDPRVDGRFVSFRVSSVGSWRMSLIGLELDASTKR
jgi:hypothetical protein